MFVCAGCEAQINDGNGCLVTYACADDLQIYCQGDSCECAIGGQAFDTCSLEVQDLYALPPAAMLDAAAACCPWLAD